MADKVYLDSCALNRLTDDQSQRRVFEEAEAITRIFKLVSDGDLLWVVSTALEIELGGNPNDANRETSLALLTLGSETAIPEMATRTRRRATVRRVRSFRCASPCVGGASGGGLAPHSRRPFSAARIEAGGNQPSGCPQSGRMACQEATMAAQALTEQMTDEQFERHAFKVLAQELGLGGLARFIRLNRSGRGDYTAERHQWQAGLTVEDILREMDVQKQ